MQVVHCIAYCLTVPVLPGNAQRIARYLELGVK